MCFYLPESVKKKKKKKKCESNPDGDAQTTFKRNVFNTWDPYAYLLTSS
jgi:hypothetical protein